MQTVRVFVIKNIATIFSSIKKLGKLKKQIVVQLVSVASSEQRSYKYPDENTTSDHFHSST